MLLRIRSNLSVLRLEVSSDDNLTFLQLSQLVMTKCNIQHVQFLIFAKDMTGKVVYDPQQKLSEVGIKHGDELFVMGKFEEVLIEKAYINEQHELVPAGKSWKMVTLPEGYEDMVRRINGTAEENVKKVEEKQVTEPAPAPQLVMPTVTATQSSSQHVSQPSYSAKAGNHTQKADEVKPASQSLPLPQYMEDYIPDEDFDFQEDGIRAPDASQRMTLLQNDPNTRLTDEEQREVAALRKRCTDIGMREYETEQEIMRYVDEILAKKMARVMEFEDQRDNFGFGMTTLEELEKLLSRTGVSTSSRSGNLNNFNRNRFNVSNSMPPAASSSSRTKPRNLAASGQRVLSVPSSSGVDRKPSGTSQPPRSPDRAEEEWLRSQSAHASSSTTRAAKKESNQDDGSMLETLRKRAAERARAVANTVNSSSSSSAYGLENEDGLSSIERLRRASASTSSVPRASNNVTASTSNPRGTRKEMKPDSASLGLDDDDSLMQLALEMSLQQPPSTNTTSAPRGSSRELDSERASNMMRDYLHHGDSMPAWLKRSIDKSTEDELLNFAVEQSQWSEPTPQSRSTTSVAAHRVEYDDDDELLAKALQESLEQVNTNVTVAAQRAPSPTVTSISDEDAMLAKILQESRDLQKAEEERRNKFNDDDEALARAIQESLRFS